MLTHVETKRRANVVVLRSDDGSSLEVPLVNGEAPDLTGYFTGAFALASPAPPSIEEKMAALEAENAALKKALIDGGKLTQAELDAAAVAAVAEVKG